MNVEKILEAIINDKTSVALDDSGYNQKFIELTIEQIKRSISDIKV
jgi:hypothetical protein